MIPVELVRLEDDRGYAYFVPRDDITAFEAVLCAALFFKMTVTRSPAGTWMAWREYIDRHSLARYFRMESK